MRDKTTPVLEIEDLTIDFATQQGRFTAVSELSFSIGEDESVSIIGESGSGKSVTANAILGLVDCPPGRVRGGDIRFRGRSLLSLTPAQREEINGRRIAMVFQDPLSHLNPVFPVGWQVAEVCRIHGESARAARRTALELLERVGIPDPSVRADSYPHQFSGGQRQRIMIAMAIAKRPDLLVADEPTTALDVTVQAQILDLLREIRAEVGMSLLMITHDLKVAAETADRILVMKRGRMVETGTAHDVLVNPQHAYTKQLVADQTRSYRLSARPNPDRLLEVSNLDIHYGDYHAVKNVSLHVDASETLGVIGESGSGKSSVARAILRLQQIGAGTIRFSGSDISQSRGEQLTEYRRSVQAVFQDPFSSLNPRMTIRKILCEPWVLNPGVVEKRSWRDEAARLLDLVGMSPGDLEKYPTEFSGGQCQRIAIARSIALGPKLVVLDEAVSALDMTIRAQIMELLADLRARLGLSYIFIAHDLSLVRNFADRVAVMKDGAIVEQGPTAEIFSQPVHEYTRELISAGILNAGMAVA